MRAALPVLSAAVPENDLRKVNQAIRAGTDLPITLIA
jgi:hypothetical protein